MDGVPLKIPKVPSQAMEEGSEVVVPDYLTILQETEYEFTLEKWVLAGVQSDFKSQQWPQLPSLSGLHPSCPPYWMMFSSPQQSSLANRHCSDFWEPNPRKQALNPSVVPDSEDKEQIATGEAETCSSGKVSPCVEHLVASCQPGQKKAQKAFIPNFFNPPACLSSLPHQRRKNLRQCSLPTLDLSNSCDLSQSKNLSLSRTTDTKVRADTLHGLTSINNRSTTSKSLSRSCSQIPTASTSHLDLTPSGQDYSAELLTALTPEERELLGAITTRGYPLHTAIIALQKMGSQTPDQIFSYLLACDHLCQLGYDMVQVEEALEMFQNCERRAEEFLHLLNQFNEMGFQQNAIKEVLLVHENHRERALEELMMRVSS